MKENTSIDSVGFYFSVSFEDELDVAFQEVSGISK